ncbi:N-formylglutamate amidohydrolase [Sphingosinicellaceae bacterium]|nr:N-formylglutamate amidohydrolase [Sphingosinicellaceae bacterium]
MLPLSPAPLPGFTVTGDRDGRWPVVLASPHSGRDYPADFLARTRLTLAQLRRAEDAYVDGLLDGAAATGVPRIMARYGRSWLDLNRAAAELDPAMYVEPFDAHADQSTDRVQAGLGVVPRIAGHGLDIYPTRLRLDEARARIEAVHRPWHATLEELTDSARARHGFAVLLDCHSMPTPAPSAGGTAQIVLGDLFGRSAATPLVEAIATYFAVAGLRVARNAPYAGGYTTACHGRPELGVHTVQIEIDRALYMDPSRLTRHMGFATIAALLTGLVAQLVEITPRLGLAAPFAQAAE